MKISIDSGKSQMKVAYKQQGSLSKTMFLSNIAEGVNTTPTTKEAVKIKVKENGTYKTYLVGEYGVNTFTENSQDINKRTEAHKILILSAIVKMLEKVRRPDVLEVEIAVNMPLNLFKIDGEVTRTQDYYTNDGKFYEVEYNGINYSFKIKNVVVYFEGIGPILMDHYNYCNREVLSLDFGSFNVGYATFKDNKPIGVLSGSLNNGINKLMAEIDDVLIINNLSYLTRDNIHDVINGSYSVKNEVREQIDAKCLNHVKTVKNELSRRNININMEIVASGGGAIMLERFLKTEFNNITVADDYLFSNASAGLLLLK